MPQKKPLELYQLDNQPVPSNIDTLTLLAVEAHELKVAEALAKGESVPGIFDFELPPHTP